MIEWWSPLNINDNPLFDTFRRYAPDKVWTEFYILSGDWLISFLSTDICLDRFVN